MDHLLILAISEFGPTGWTLIVIAVTSLYWIACALKGRNDDR